MVRTKRADFNALAERFGIDPVIARIMVNRGVESEDMEGYLHPTKEQLHDEGTMKDLREAADIIATAIDAGKRIRAHVAARTDRTVGNISRFIFGENFKIILSILIYRYTCCVILGY
ncbi:MAG: hypothetical protein II506_00420, partial [Lachnospiraceae bacterium]|nr:hypothetical protein [Lachnospiraceae bacterium]